MINQFRSKIPYFWHYLLSCKCDKTGKAKNNKKYVKDDPYPRECNGKIETRITGLRLVFRLVEFNEHCCIPKKHLYIKNGTIMPIWKS